MRRRLVLGVGFAAVASLASPLASQQPARHVVLRAQPSVLQVIMAIDVDFTRRLQFGLKLGADGVRVLDSEYAAAAGHLPPGTTRAEFSWQRIAEDPDRYLHLQGRETTFTIANRPYATGTGFVVDQAGTLLTNQHVIDVRMVPRDPAALAGLLANDLDGFVKRLIQVIGAPPPDEFVPAIDRVFVPWVLTQYQCRAVRLSEVRVATHLQPGALPRVLSIKAAPVVPDWKKSTVACEVLATGEPYPGKDVAVIRAASLASRLISLPLGDSSRFALGSNVYALGFPSAAVIDGVDREAARFRVIAQDGIIDQRLPLRTGWEIFHMTANTNHGNSGGPVIDEKGRVVAIAVAGSNKAASQNLAVPINIARELLARVQVIAGVRNEVTTEWNAGCDDVEAGKYADALVHFQKVEQLQGGWGLAGVSGGSQASEMIELCKQEGALPTSPGAVPPKFGLRNLGKPKPEDHGWLPPSGKRLELGAASSQRGWWDTVCDVWTALPLYQQALLVVLALSGLIGLLKMVRSLF